MVFKQMLKSYPDYGKASVEYVASMVEIIAEYSPSIQKSLLNLRYGIRGLCKYLPTVADVVELADKFERDEIASRPKPQKPVLVEWHQSPEERARIGEKMVALAAELKKVNIIEPTAPKEPYRRPKMSIAAVNADIAARRERNTPERIAAVEAAVLAEDQAALERALAL